jgi:hypothetical protein
MARLDSVFPMMVAVFDPSHLPVDLCQNCRSALLWANDGVIVWSRRHEIASIVACLELDTPATKMLVRLYTWRERKERTIVLLA